MPYKISFVLLSTVLCTVLDNAFAQYSPCQIQSFFVSEYGSARGNLLRVHANNHGVPMNVSFTGSCDNTTLSFTRFLERRKAIRGSVAITLRWELDSRYVLAVKQRSLVLEFFPGPRSSPNQWFLLKACAECLPGLNKLESLLKPHLFVLSNSYGLPFMEQNGGRMAWFKILDSACSYKL